MVVSSWEVLILLAFLVAHLPPGCGSLARGLTGLADPNQELECAVKDLVLEYARYIQPEVKGNAYESQ